MQITLKVYGNDRLQDKLTNLGASLFQMNGAMERIGDELTTYFSGQAFASQGGVFDEVWPELNEKYALRKARDWATPIMVQTGDMQDSFEYEASDTGVVISNTSDHFVYHQSSEPRTVIPYRPMIGVNDDIQSIAQQIVDEEIGKKLEAF